MCHKLECLHTCTSLTHLTGVAAVLITLLHLTDVDIPAANCSDWDLRLVDGEIDNEGRLEICFNNAWSTACGGSRWEKDFTEDVCRELGYAASGEHLHSVSENP